MNIYISKICGLCYGAKRAIEGAIESAKNNKNIVTFKEILHNKNVMKELENKGIKQKDNIEDINKDDFVIIRGHGEPYSTFKYFDKNNIKYLDCTCPNVKAINLLVKSKNEEGYKIIIVGKYGFKSGVMHPEVKGTAGWCESPIFIEDESEIEKIDLKFNKYYLVVQTTFSFKKAEIFINKIKDFMTKNNKVFECKNTICNAQKIINQEALKLAENVDVMIVVGGKYSSNSKELYNNISKIVSAFFIESAEEVITLINENKIHSKQIIGITAGTSTPKEDITSLKNLIENLLK